jgi:small subunit ribosomal protein S9
MPTKSTTPAKGPKAAAVKKPRAVKKVKEAAPVAADEPIAEVTVIESVSTAPSVEKPTIEGGRYVFATGRRKTSVANVRLFSGKGETLVNKKPLKQYFGYSVFADEVLKPLSLTGFTNDFYGVCTVNGGGVHSQAQAVRHGFAIAIGKLSEEARKVLKKNGLLTRDDRKKERKKPGLKRARRSPQWAKR